MFVNYAKSKDVKKKDINIKKPTANPSNTVLNLTRAEMMTSPLPKTNPNATDSRPVSGTSTNQLRSITGSFESIEQRFDLGFSPCSRFN